MRAYPTALLTIASLCLSVTSAHAQTQSPPLSDLLKSIPAGTGYAAWDLCSRGIAVGDDVDRVKTQYTAPKVQPLPSFWFINDTDSKVDVSAVFLYPRRAIFRKGLGCTLITSNSLQKELGVRAQPFKAVMPPAANPAKPWPLGEGAAQNSALSPDRHAVLASAAATMFSETSTDPAKKVNTNALLVAQGGQLVYEQYAPSFNRERPQLGWSMTKTLTGLVAGLMERDGLIALDAPVGLTRWKGTDKAAIKWRHLLNMAPGLQWVEGGYGIGDDDTTKMLFSNEDQCAWAADKPLVATPGTVFNYSTGFANLAMCRLKELAGGTHQNIYDYYQRRLFAPLGIRGGYVEPDASGTPVGGARGMLRPVDWLRLGQLVANGGRWNGQTLLNPTYVQFMATPSPANGGYGGTMWRQATELLPADLRGQLPEDLVFFAGFQEQHVVVVPSRQLVVLRQGVAFDNEAAIRQAYQLVIDLLAHP
jgi:CubicO group peptidase (beta-lactamase class C family)